MKTSKSGYYVLLFTGVLLMSCFGSEITNVIEPSKSWAGRLLLPGYSLGLMMFCGSLFARLSSHVKDLESKIEKLESDMSSPDGALLRNVGL